MGQVHRAGGAGAPGQVHHAPQVGGAVLVLPQSGQQDPHRPDGDGVGEPGHLPGGEDQAAGDGGLGGPDGGHGLGGEVVVVGAEAAHRVRHPGYHLGVELLQQGDDLAAELVPGVGGVGVGAVLHMGEGMGGQIGLHFHPSSGQKGPDEPPPPGADAGEPLEAAPPDEVEEHSLHVVVGGVGGGDAAGPHRFGGPLQKVIAQGPGGLLDAGAPAPGLGGHVPLPHHTGDLPVPAQVPDEGGVPVGLRPPEPVVEVGGGEGKALLLRPAPEPVEEAHRVGPAGDGAEDVAPGGEHGVFPCEGLGLVQHGISTPGGSGRWRRRWCTRAATGAPPSGSRRGGSWR